MNLNTYTNADKTLSSYAIKWKPKKTQKLCLGQNILLIKNYLIIKIYLKLKKNLDYYFKHHAQITYNGTQHPSAAPAGTKCPTPRHPESVLSTKRASTVSSRPLIRVPTSTIKQKYWHNHWERTP